MADSKNVVLTEDLPLPYRNDIIQAVNVLRNGGIILYPTDTVWGIGCDATWAASIERVYGIKQRPAKQSLLVLAADMDMLQRYVRNIPDVALQLLEYADKPMSIIYPSAQNLPFNLVADDGSIGIRLPHDSFCLDLLREFGKPVVSTSANISGTSTPSVFEKIDNEIKNAVDYVVQWRQNDIHPASASSVVKVEDDNTFRIVRRGYFKR
ncbi:MAG: threonylcarbamoyl-AMP synthase [Bacteroidales bacterium]|jgi:L-threonylcarbamoyladenylate synthase|nr:threonylcarbamoyl-AMP synthase [Bacteroidales bacterium]